MNETLNPKYHAVIKGWDALYRYCERRWKERPRFIEHFARIADCRIERIEARPPGEKYYREYFILDLPNERGYRLEYDRHGILQAIENGTIKLLNV